MTATETSTTGPVAATAAGRRDAVLTIEHLDVVYETEHPVHAVKDVSLTLAPGEILGLAGESGCGKTTLAYAITRLHKPPAKVTSGSITFHDRDGSDVDLLGLGHDQDAGRGGVHASLRLGDRHPLDAVHPTLELQQRVGRLTGLDVNRGLNRA